MLWYHEFDNEHVDKRSEKKKGFVPEEKYTLEELVILRGKKPKKKPKPIAIFLPEQWQQAKETFDEMMSANPGIPAVGANHGGILRSE